MKCLTVGYLAALGVSVAAAGETAPALELRPAAMVLEGPPAVEVRRSCVLRYRAGGMNVLSAAASDPGVTVDVREHLETRNSKLETRGGRNGTPAESIYFITATIPAGYRTFDTAHRETRGGKTAGGTPAPQGPGSQSPARVEILVRTDLAASPEIRIPVRVWPRNDRPSEFWLNGPRAWVGQPWPEMVMDRAGGGQIQVRAEEDKVTILVFSAHYCGHCDEHVPVLERVWKDYAERDVRFLGVAVDVGSDAAIAEAAKRWGLDWPLGIDRRSAAVEKFGTKAFPVVFVVGRDGIVEAVHGRWSNGMTNNGLDDLEFQLRTELEILLAFGSGKDFPDWDAMSEATAPTTQPPSDRPAGPAIEVEAEVPPAGLARAEETRGKKTAGGAPVPQERVRAALSARLSQLRAERLAAGINGGGDPEPASPTRVSQAPVPETCPSGATLRFKIPVRNPGLQSLKLADVRPGEGVSLVPNFITEVPPGGVAILRCTAVAPEQAGPFARRIEIASNDPNNPVAAIALRGTVAAGNETTRHTQHREPASEQVLGSIR